MPHIYQIDKIGERAFAEITGNGSYGLRFNNIHDSQVDVAAKLIIAHGPASKNEHFLHFGKLLKNAIDCVHIPF